MYGIRNNDGVIKGLCILLTFIFYKHRNSTCTRQKYTCNMLKIH